MKVITKGTKVNYGISIPSSISDGDINTAIVQEKTSSYSSLNGQINHLVLKPSAQSLVEDFFNPFAKISIFLILWDDNNILTIENRSLSIGRGNTRKLVSTLPFKTPKYVKGNLRLSLCLANMTENSNIDAFLNQNHHETQQVSAFFQSNLTQLKAEEQVSKLVEALNSEVKMAGMKMQCCLHHIVGEQPIGVEEINNDFITTTITFYK